MLRITPGTSWPLFDVAGTRAIEQAAAASMPPHTLMQRAGLASARLALAIAPHARTAWIACGPGNNGGDGLEAAMHLAQWGKRVRVTWAGDESRAPADARTSLARARAGGVEFADEPPAGFELAVDALLGIGSARPLEGRMAQWAAAMAAGDAPVLAIDVPSGLDANTGAGNAVRATHTLSLLTLKPGLFTAGGRDASGQVWFDDLGVDPSGREPVALLPAAPHASPRAHDSHKGRFGDVAVVGGAPGMTGAALLAASAALFAGAGRVFVGLLDGGSVPVDASRPELMFRGVESLDFASMSVACGCGGGDAVRAVLPRVLSTAHALVLDADALNAIAADPQLQEQLRARGRRGRPTVLTPHPLEAARLLSLSTAQVQSDRIAAAKQLAERFACACVLKGSGTVIASPGRPASINPTGNGLLATAGTGDVLAGMIAARLAAGAAAFEAACDAVFEHGRVADEWPPGRAFSAGLLAANL